MSACQHAWSPERACALCGMTMMEHVNGAPLPVVRRTGFRASKHKRREPTITLNAEQVLRLAELDLWSV